MRLRHERGRQVVVRPPHWSPSGARAERGQTLVEFALVLPVFLLIVFGLIDVGRLVYTNSALSQAAREGARLAAAEAGWIGDTSTPACVADESLITASNPGAHVCPTDIPALKSHVSDAANRMTVLLGPVTDIHISCNAGTVDDLAPSGEWTEASGGNGCKDGAGNAISSAGDLISVRAEYTYDLFTPIISSFIGSTSLSSAATIAGVSARALGSFAASPAPADAKWGRPPPRPPLTAAIRFTTSPAFTPREIRSSVTPTCTPGRSPLTNST